MNPTQLRHGSEQFHHLRSHLDWLSDLTGNWAIFKYDRLIFDILLALSESW